MSDGPKYPEVQVHLSSGIDANGMVVMTTVRRALRDAGVDQEEIDEFTLECTSGDYDHLLQTCMEWVEVS